MVLQSSQLGGKTREMSASERQEETRARRGLGGEGRGGGEKRRGIGEER